MENMMWTVKFVLFLGIQVFVVATVVAVLVAGLYQLVLSMVHSILGKVRGSRIFAPATARKSG
ncbi:MAG: hypothetical protein KKC18_13375 [Chloroflexi bacterium]|nr:hypothetical protein [Chloroflexota bacterium]